MKNTLGILAAAFLIVAAIACNLDETSKANTLVDEANVLLRTANASVEKATKLSDELDSQLGKISDKSDLEDARKTAKDLNAEYDSMADNFKKAAEKFEEASKLKIKDAHKQYLETKAKELRIRSDYAIELKKIPTELIENDSKSQFQDVVSKTMEKVKAMTKEAQELSEKADKIVKDNPGVLEQSPKN
ncbi:MAG: hypothetical protein KF736_11560 [Acidobacteria bacterium]|nr:hypothetical protein [Acidobacteriota bacterium]MCW5949959.1 hypothetical protein [Pyrinomonadaceae bacterium]